MAVSEEVAARILAKCGRCCCLCRRYRPTLLQVHHIVEVSEGGTDDEDNLIAVCLTCHSDVHTRRPFSRRFTADELKQHRDAVYRLVAEGRLVPPETDELIMSTFRCGTHGDEIRSMLSSLGTQSLSNDAMEVLISAASADGVVIIMPHLGGCDFRAGTLTVNADRDHRVEERYRHAISQLASYGFLRRLPSAGRSHSELYRVNHNGYLMADELQSLSHRVALSS